MDRRLLPSTFASTLTITLTLSSCGGGGGGGTEPPPSTTPPNEPDDLTEQQVIDNLSQEYPDFEAGDMQGTIGAYVDEAGFKLGLTYQASLPASAEDYNANPDGEEEGGLNCIRNIPVGPSPSLSVDNTGCLPYEVVPATVDEQALSTASLKSTTPFLQSFSCEEDTATGTSCTSMGTGFKLQGPVDYVMCEDTELTKLSEEGRTSHWGLSVDDAKAFASDFELGNCEAYAFSGDESGNALEGSIKGEFTLVDSSAPQVSLDSVSYSETLENGNPREFGEACVSGSATDEQDGALDVEYALVSQDGTLEQTDYEIKDGKACFALGDFAGLEAYIRASAQDSSGNSASVDSDVFNVDENNAPTCHQTSTPIYNAGSGVRDLSSALSCSDAEGDEISFSNNMLETNGLTQDGSRSVNHTDGRDSGSTSVDYNIDVPSYTAPSISISDYTIGGTEGQTINPITLAGASCSGDGSLSITPTNYTLPSNVTDSEISRDVSLDLTCSNQYGSDSDTVNVKVCNDQLNGYDEADNSCFF